MFFFIGHKYKILYDTNLFRESFLSIEVLGKTYRVFLPTPLLARREISFIALQKHGAKQLKQLRKKNLILRI